MKTQREKILELLKQNPAGINSFGFARDIALQLPTRIKELKEIGYGISSTTLKDRSVQYKLESHPIQDKPFKWDFSNGFARRVYE